MTQEEKQLLLRDLCARLPYSVRVKELEPIKELELYLTSIYHDTVQVETVTGGKMACSIEAIKPYLRPMSSMTEKEREIVNNLIYNKENIWTSPIPVWVINESDIEEYVDFCNSHHLDYRSLIKKGLALEAPEGMY